jgi:hypothetical protein
MPALQVSARALQDGMLASLQMTPVQVVEENQHSGNPPVYGALGTSRPLYVQRKVRGLRKGLITKLCV